MRQPTNNDIMQVLVVIQSGLSKVNLRLDVIDQRLDALETRMDGLETRMDGLETRMTHLELDFAQFQQETREGFLGVAQAIEFTHKLIEENYKKLKPAGLH